MIVKRVIELDMGHVLPNYDGPCGNLHGHRVKVICSFEGSVSPNRETGMVEDFSYLKQIMMREIHDVMDHGFAVWKNDTVDVMGTLGMDIRVSVLDFIKVRNKKYLITDDPPTAETLAKHFGEKVRMAILDRPFYLHSLEWWETPNNCAVYFPGEDIESFDEDFSLKEKLSEKGY